MLRWQACARIPIPTAAPPQDISLLPWRARSDEGLMGEEQLQSWFLSRINAILQQRGRKLIGWDEVRAVLCCAVRHCMLHAGLVHQRGSELVELVGGGEAASPALRLTKCPGIRCMCTCNSSANLPRVWSEARGLGPRLLCAQVWPT